VLPVAERTKKQAKKAAKTEKPAVLTGTPPEWANATAISKLLGKGVRRIQQLTQEGVLETEIPPGGGARKYRTCETVQKYIAHVEAKAQETGENSRTAELNLKKLEAEVELKESQGQLHRLKTAIAEGKYISAEQATEELAEFMAAFKKFTKNIPPRAVGALAGNADPVTVRVLKKSMGKELDTMLAAYAGAAVEQLEEAETP
jgi:phage terminase Nu1 subunit (DNA packaging protein)